MGAARRAGIVVAVQLRPSPPRQHGKKNAQENKKTLWRNPLTC
jgi:hypothetical protein